MTEENKEIVVDETPAEEVVAPVVGDGDFDAAAFEAELDKGVENIVAEQKAEKEEAKSPEEKKAAAKATPAKDDPKKDAKADPKADEQSKPAVEQEKVDEEATDEAKPAEISDAVVERAVKVGFTIAQAKGFQDTDSLERTIELLELKADTGSVEEKTDDEEIDLLAAIPELDPEEYDPKIIEAVDGLKAAVKTLTESNKELKAKRNDVDTTAAVEEGAKWFDSSIKELGKDFSDKLGAGATSQMENGGDAYKARVELSDKVYVLARGYEGAGKEVSRDQLFKEAVALVFPGKVAGVKAKVTTDAAIARETQLTKGAGRTNDAPTKKGAVSLSIEEQVGKEINDEIFAKHTG